jgi:beta-lactamase class A
MGVRNSLWLRRLAIAGLCGLLAAPAQARRFEASATGPVQATSYRHDHLRSWHDAALQQQLDDQLQQLRLGSALRQHKLAVALVDITDLSRPRLAMANGDVMLYAASLPKIAILLAAYQRRHEGRLRWDRWREATVTDMIRVSSNRAASQALGWVGQKYLQRLLQSSRYKLYDKHYNGGLWVGRGYGGGGVATRDPLHNLSHGATAFQVARFYHLLAARRLVSPAESREMKRVMSAPGIRHKFVAGLATTHPEARLYRKSGSWRSFHADSALVERGERSYIAVALADDPRGEQWLRQLIVVFDRIIFSHPNRAFALSTPSCLSRYVCRIPYRYAGD